MADQCIVCLEPLDIEASAAPTPPAGDGAAPAPQQPLLLKDGHERLAIEDADALANANHEHHESHGTGSGHDNHENVAKIEVCGHMLHDACLREWTEKANSCPICRQTFHAVAVYDKVGGMSRHRTPVPRFLVAAVD
jgi:hypothetical protein